MKQIRAESLNQISGKDQEELRISLKERGCFILEGCFDIGLVRNVHRALMNLFASSIEVKQQCFVDKRLDARGHGFSPFGIAKALDTGIPNLLETWDISPEKINWPKLLGNEWQIIRNYQHEIAKLAIIGIQTLEIVLDSEKGDLKNLIDENSIEGIHLIHYFPIPKNRTKGARRQSQHCDNTLITVIPPPFPVITGLDVFNRETQKWEHVIIPENSCLIQAGLILEHITCGVIKACLHTVTNPRVGSKENCDRYSTPFFLSPKTGSRIYILPKYQNQCEPNNVSIEQLESEYFKKIF